MYPSVRYGITRVRPDDMRGLQCKGWPVDVTGVLLLPRKDAGGVQREGPWGELACRGRSFLQTKSQHRFLFFRLILLQFGRRRRVDIDRSICGKSRRRKLKILFMHSPFALQWAFLTSEWGGFCWSLSPPFPFPFFFCSKLCFLLHFLFLNPCWQ